MLRHNNHFRYGGVSDTPPPLGKRVKREQKGEQSDDDGKNSREEQQ